MPAELAPDVEISVLLPTKNRAAILRDTLEHLRRQRANFAWELVVIDNDSSDDTAAVLEHFASRLPLRAVTERRPGTSAALNRGLEVARAPLLLITNDDVAPVPFWLEEHRGGAQRHPEIALFGGPVTPSFPKETPAWLRQHVFAGALFTAFVPCFTETELPAHVVPVGNNMMIRRSCLAGERFDETIGPGAGDAYVMGCDIDMMLRLRRRGARTVFLPKAIVMHQIRQEQLEERWLARRAYRWGRGVAHSYPDPTAPRVLGAPWYLFAWTASAWLRECAPTRDASVEERIERVLRYQFLRGLLAEERQRPRTGVVGSMLSTRTVRALRRVYAGRADRANLTATWLAGREAR